MKIIGAFPEVSPVNYYLRVKVNIGMCFALIVEYKEISNEW